MAKNLVVGGRYYDRHTKDHILIKAVTDEYIAFTVEGSDEPDNLWYVVDWETLAVDLVPANYDAIRGERNMNVMVKKLHPDAIIPEFKTGGAAGFDLHTTEDITIPPNRVIVKRTDTDLEFELANDNYAIAGTGLAFEIPDGYELEIRGRSGLAFNYRVTSYNGTVDSDYRGEVKLLLFNNGNQTITFKKGERVAQGIIKKIEQVNFIEADNLSETDRGIKGFGSTGVN